MQALLFFSKRGNGDLNKFRFMITKFTSIDEDTCEEKLIKLRSNLTLMEALHLLLEFAEEHPNCHFQDRGGVELETEDAVLSAIIEPEEE